MKWKPVSSSYVLRVCVCVCVYVLMMNAILIRSLTNAYKNYFITNYIIKVMGWFSVYFCIRHVAHSHIHASDIFVVWFSFIFGRLRFFPPSRSFICMKTVLHVCIHLLGHFFRNSTQLLFHLKWLLSLYCYSFSLLLLLLLLLFAIVVVDYRNLSHNSLWVIYLW